MSSYLISIIHKKSCQAACRSMGPARTETMRINQTQREIIGKTDLLNLLDEEKLAAIAGGEIPLGSLNSDELPEFIQIANLLYRGGEPLISDNDYDHIFIAELARRQPDHPFLHEVEPEPAFSPKTVELPTRMLSTDKAYSFAEVAAWAERIDKAARQENLDFNRLVFRATPKLDGYAAYDDGQVLYTRGDGRRGTDISRVFARGLKVADGGKRGLGAGEIVVGRGFFLKNLAAHYDNPRNFQAGIIKEKELEEHAAAAISQGAAVFYPFSLLPAWQGTWPELATDFNSIVDKLKGRVDFDVDGVVLEITNEALKEAMGATRHHYRWQIAYKENSETVEVRVLRVIAQTSRSGRVNPVAEVEPVRLSGALIRRATAHHYKMVRENGIGPGAVIELSRSGEVIPKIERVIIPAEPRIPALCPSCGAELFWDSDYLYCPNHMGCPAQITNSIEHFFRTLANIDGFGPATITKLFAHGIRTIPEIYQLTTSEFEEMGFGPKQSENLVNQLLRSRSEQIEDWRFLAAFGIYRLGPGNCEKLLAVYPLEQVLGLSEEKIIAVEGFAELTARAICKELKLIAPLFTELYQLGFTLEESKRSAGATASPIKGKLIVFTGKMAQGSRTDMEKRAKALGARTGSTITGKTDLLVTGTKVGATKLTRARENGVEIISEDEYLRMIGGHLKK